MRIEYEIKLGFKDVMFRPKRSTLKSRSQVSLERVFTFRNSKKTWNFIFVSYGLQIRDVGLLAEVSFYRLIPRFSFPSSPISTIFCNVESLTSLMLFSTFEI